MSSNILKVIYFAPRLALLSRSQFRQRWRQHGLLSMYLPGWDAIERYEQCDTLSDKGCEGVAVVRYSGDFLRSADPAALEIRARDEMEAFGERVSNFAMLVQEEAVVDQLGLSDRWFIAARAAQGAQLSGDALIRQIQPVFPKAAIAVNVAVVSVFTETSRLDADFIIEIALETGVEPDVEKVRKHLRNIVSFTANVRTRPRLLFDRLSAYDEREIMRANQK